VDHVQPGTKVIAGRWFCDEHFTKATHKRSGVWRSAAFAVVGVLIFVAAVVGLDTALKPNMSGTALLLTGVVLAIVPAALWLLFFYQQDRLEPEPVGQVVRLFVIGLALAGAIGIPITDQLFRVQDWLYVDSTAGIGLTEILGSIFVTGAVEAFILYAVVRYFIFDSAEFDERTDGVVYATAAGLGYATALNLQFILANGGSALGTGEIFVAEVALAHAAFGGLLGYFLGKAKLEQEPVWWLSLALVLTAALNGLFGILRGQLDTGGIAMTSAGAGLPTVTGLLLAGGLALVITIIVSYLINRDITRSLSGTQTKPAGDPTVGDKQSNYTVLGTAAVLLIVGTLVWNGAVNRVTAFDVGGFKGAYPAAYGQVELAEGDVLRVTDFSTGAEYSISTVVLESGQGTQTVVSQLSGQRGTDYALYKADSTDVVVGGKTALRQDFAYVASNGLTGAVPEVTQGLDYIFIDGDRAVIVTLTATPDTLADIEPAFNRFLNSLSF
jgi:RsiW-degrading membrane proteinase PrsW (M82 family)